MFEDIFCMNTYIYICLIYMIHVLVTRLILKITVLLGAGWGGGYKVLVLISSCDQIDFKIHCPFVGGGGGGL